jgi:hypothetical protein
MPKTVYLDNYNDGMSSSDGISITWTPSAQRIDIGGWYDSCVGIQGESFTLREFFDRLGITEKDCRKAWREKT